MRIIVVSAGELVHSKSLVPFRRASNVPADLEIGSWIKSRLELELEHESRTYEAPCRVDGTSSTGGRIE